MLTMAEWKHSSLQDVWVLPNILEAVTESQVSFSRAFLFPYLEERGGGRAQLFEPRCGFVFQAPCADSFSLCYQGGAREGTWSSAQFSPTGFFLAPLQGLAETQVNSLQPKFGSVFEMLPVRWGSWFTKLSQRMMRLLEAAVTVKWAQASCRVLYSWLHGGGPLSQMHGKQVQRRQWFKTHTDTSPKSWGQLPGGNPAASAIERVWFPGHVRLGAAGQSDCGNWLRCHFRKPALRKGSPLVDLRKMRCLCSVVSDSLQPHGLAHQLPLSMDFSRQEHWRRVPFPSPGELPDPGITPMSFTSPALAGWVLYHCRHLGSWTWGSFLLISVFPFHFGA